MNGMSRLAHLATACLLALALVADSATPVALGQTAPSGLKIDARVVEVTPVAFSPALIAPYPTHNTGDDGSGGMITPVWPAPYSPGINAIPGSLDPNSLSSIDSIGQQFPTGPGPVPGVYLPAHGARIGGSNGGTAVVQATIAVRVTLDGQPVSGAFVSFGTYEFPPTDAEGVSVGNALFPAQVGGVQGGTVYAKYGGYEGTTDVYLPR